MIDRTTSRQARNRSVSVIIPVRNCEKFLADALDSVRSQTVRPQEILVVDDGSTDGSAALAERFEGVEVLRLPQQGQSVARNVGAERACGEYLAFLDADDLWHPERLSKQLAAFDSEPDVNIAFAHAIEFRSRDAFGKPVWCGPARAAHLPGTLLIRRHEFWSVGGYATEWRVGEVVDWYARACDLGLKVVTLEEALLFRRLHTDNLGITTSNPAQDYLRIIRSVIQRRRNAQD